MLSYLKEGTSVEPPAASEGPAAERGQEEYLTTAHRGKSAKQSTMILAVLFAVGAVVVWWMIKKVSPGELQAVGDDTAKIEEVIAQLNSFKSEVNGKMDTMVGRFYQASELGQIGVNELKKNPFCLETNTPEPATAADLSEGRLQMLREEVNRQSGRLQLWSITERKTNPCCMINDKVLYVGDSIEGFTVRQIQQQRVVVEQDGVQVELKMPE